MKKKRAAQRKWRGSFLSLFFPTFPSDPCLATDCKYANKFHFHCLFGNCKYVCKTSGKAESHCLDHINPNNNLMNVRDQFAYYSLQCLCPNQVRGKTRNCASRWDEEREKEEREAGRLRQAKQGEPVPNGVSALQI